VHDVLQRQHILSARGRCIEHDDALERRQLAADLEYFLELCRVRYEYRAHTRVPQNERDLLRWQCGIERHREHARAQQRVVGPRPLRPVLRQQSNAVAARKAPRAQCSRDVAHVR
jgi:hypothetical protein